MQWIPSIKSFSTNKEEINSLSINMGLCKDNDDNIYFATWMLETPKGFYLNIKITS
jgi:hypothetical protein